METQTKQLADLCAELGITAGARLVRKPLDWDLDTSDGKTDWRDGAFRWFVTLAHEGREWGLDYWCGRAHATLHGKPMPRRGLTIYERELAERDRRDCKPTPPSVADVVYSLCMDADALDMGFAEWAGETGYSDDSIKARDLYLKCQDHAREAKRVLGKDFEACRSAEH